MARPLSDAKRLALLQAAIETIAVHGTGAPTAAIAKLAGVAEGTLFKYFSTKNELLNAVYLALKAELRVALLAEVSSRGSTKSRSKQLWSNYINWGVAHPSHRRAMSQLAVSDTVTDETRRLGSEGFEAFRELIQDWRGLCHPAWTQKTKSAFASAMLTALADTTIDFVTREPRRAEEFTNAGFEAFWRAASQSRRLPS
jgi:AcrR family transcriptional regulator